MKGVDSIYLGYNNPRQAFTFPELTPTLVVLIDGPHHKTLHNSDAVGFKNHIRELNHHLMGIAYSERMADLIRKTDLNNEAYDAVFDDYWRFA